MLLQLLNFNLSTDAEKYPQIRDFHTSNETNI